MGALYFLLSFSINLKLDYKVKCINFKKRECELVFYIQKLDIF